MTDPDGHTVYDGHAASCADTSPDVAARADYEPPMVEGLLPADDGRRVPDAGISSGRYAALIAGRGAEVVGIDASEAMVDLARERHTHGWLSTMPSSDTTATGAMTTPC
ncbi:MAG: class I SAM-dependent methyltransferase [Halobacteriales archaeon]